MNPLLYGAVRGLLVATLLALGGTAVTEILARRANTAGLERGMVIRGWLARLPGLLAWFLLTLSLGRGVMQVLTFHDPGAPIDPELAKAVLGTGSWGAGWMIQTLGAFILTGLAFLLRERDAWRVRAVLAFTVIFLLAQAGMGHGADAHWQPLMLGRIVTFAHLAGATLWLGTLAILAMAILPSLGGSRDRTALARILDDFSVLARCGAALVAVSGVIAVLRYTDNLGQLFTTSWGQLLLVKLVAFLGVLGAGWWNWKVVTPRLVRDETASVAALRRAVAVELLLAAAVLGVSAALVNGALPIDG